LSISEQKSGARKRIKRNTVKPTQNQTKKEKEKGGEQKGSRRSRYGWRNESFPIRAGPWTRVKVGQIRHHPSKKRGSLTIADHVDE